MFVSQVTVFCNPVYKIKINLSKYKHEKNEILKSRLVLTSNEYKTVSERDMPSENQLPDRLIILKVCVKFILNWGEF